MKNFKNIQKIMAELENDEVATYDGPMNMVLETEDDKVDSDIPTCWSMLKDE